MNEKSPTTEKTTSLAMHSDTTEHNASSLLYKKLKGPNRGISRTLYYGDIKKFQPKKSTMVDPETYIENLTAPSFQ